MKVKESKKKDKVKNHYEGVAVEVPIKKQDIQDEDKKQDTGIKSIKRTKKEAQKFSEKTTAEKLKLLEKLHPY